MSTSVWVRLTFEPRGAALHLGVEILGQHAPPPSRGGGCRGPWRSVCRRCSASLILSITWGWLASGRPAARSDDGAVIGDRDRLMGARVMGPPTPSPGNRRRFPARSRARRSGRRASYRLRCRLSACTAISCSSATATSSGRPVSRHRAGACRSKSLTSSDARLAAFEARALEHAGDRNRRARRGSPWSMAFAMLFAIVALRRHLAAKPRERGVDETCPWRVLLSPVISWRMLKMVCEIWLAVSSALAFAWKLRCAAISPTQLLGDVDVRALDRARHQRAEAVQLRLAETRLARNDRSPPRSSCRAGAGPRGW